MVKFSHDPSNRLSSGQKAQRGAWLRQRNIKKFRREPATMRSVHARTVIFGHRREGASPLREIGSGVS
jgi:hypothetical protein